MKILYFAQIPGNNLAVYTIHYFCTIFWLYGQRSKREVIKGIWNLFMQTNSRNILSVYFKKLITDKKINLETVLKYFLFLSLSLSHPNSFTFLEHFQPNTLQLIYSTISSNSCLGVVYVYWPTIKRKYADYVHQVNFALTIWHSTRCTNYNNERKSTFKILFN